VVPLLLPDRDCFVARRRPIILVYRDTSGQDAAVVPTRYDALQAAKALRGRVLRTPVLRCSRLDELAGASLWLKAENLQLGGAFKARGALYAIGELPALDRQRGVVTYSSGNHGRAVALAARQYGIAATVAVPTTIARTKLDALHRLGADVVFAGTTSQHRRDAALEHHRQTGANLIEPFDATDIIAGAATATLELCEQVAEQTHGAALDALIVPVGGGGLLAGACLAAPSSTEIFTAEPISSDAFARSWSTGRRIVVVPGASLADGLRPVAIGELNLAIARDRVRGCFTVDDDELGSTVVRLLAWAKILVEPSGAAALAVCLREQLPNRPERVGILLSGGNIDTDVLRQLLERHGSDIL
jgi:threonine dehydratase